MAFTSIHLPHKQGTRVWLIETNASTYTSSRPDGDERNEDVWMDMNSIKMRMVPKANRIWDIVQYPSDASRNDL